MAFLRKETSEGSVALLYSIIQKCIRRGLESEALYYSQVLYNEATPNSLRKRLVYVTNEDIGHIKLSNEILDCSDDNLFKYLVICCRLKKTHDPAWLSRLALHYSMNNKSTSNKELIEACRMTEYVRDDDYKSIRSYIKGYTKLYTFSGRNNLVWASYILFNSRKELNQSYSLDITLPKPRKFEKVPFWVMDKHVRNGNKGYEFFFKNSLVVNENIYGESGDKYAKECKEVYLEDEKNLGNGKTKVLYQKWKNNTSKTSNDLETEKPTNQTKPKKNSIKFYLIKKNTEPQTTQKDTESISKDPSLNGFTNVVQIQLMTSKYKMPVYFATSISDGKKYALKGPLNDNMIRQINKTENTKKKLGLHHLNVKFINLNEKIYMKSDSLVDYKFDEKVLKTSKIEDTKYIYNGENSNINFDTIDDSNFVNMFEQYMFRLVLGCNDHCARNFIEDKKTGKIYSIDDHCLDLDFDDLFKIKMKNVSKTKWKEYVVKYKKDLLTILKNWHSKIDDDNMKLRTLKIINIIE